jgi:hypothetical protein
VRPPGPFQEKKIMVIFLVGAVIGAGLAVGAILAGFKVQTMESWQEEKTRSDGRHTCLWMVMAENAKLRVALATGEMTDDGKKIAAMTMAALGTVTSATCETILGEASAQPSESIQTSSEQ